MKYYSELLGLLALVVTVSSDALPYNPTTIFTAPNSTYAYIFQPSAQSRSQADLLSVDLREPFTASQPPFLTISDTLPFLPGTGPVSYTPVIDSDGNITVIAGNCSAGAGGTRVWRFQAFAGSSMGNGTWTQSQISTQKLGEQSAVAGPNFLSNGIAFSEYVNGDVTSTSIFTFGGMCPSANSTTDTWTSAALYSNQMISLTPDQAHSGIEDYGIMLATSRGPPIAEAGFSMTALQPTFSQKMDNVPQTQQQDFVLLGGHTQTAFINMSQVALYSLPQESWTFLPVDQPTGAKTDLATRQSQNQVEPRSGHTAVLTEDGKNIVVFGGWVGDVSTPARPQLAVLNLGAGYGGSGDWAWSIPSQSGKGLAAGAGLYGHGTTMLPGGVMMVMGGYTIPATSSKRIRRRAQTASSQTLLYNTTSNSWIDGYTPPTSLDQASQQQNGGPLSRKSQQAGLGAGLGIGAAILVSLVVFYFWYSKRLARLRREREHTLLSRSSGASSLGPAQQPFLEIGGIDGRGGDSAALGRFWNVWDPSESFDAPQMEQQSGTAGSTGLFVNVPSPTRGLRKGTASRNYQYHAAPRFDDKRLSRGSGNIHTITEHDDEDDIPKTRKSDDETLSDAERKLREVERVLNSTDPFLEAEPNPLGSHPVSPEMGEGVLGRPASISVSQFAFATRRSTNLSQDIGANWTVEPGPSEMVQGGRISPSKSNDRTSSTLSERSEQSAASSSSITRTMSTRTGAMLAAAMAARHARDSSPEHSPIDEKTHTMSTTGSRKPRFHNINRPRSSTIGSGHPGPPNSAGTDGDYSNTARTNFARLQSEGEILLGGRPTSMLDADGPYQRALAAHSLTHPKHQPPALDSAALASATPRRPQNWMGSLRRALNAVSIGERSFSLTGSSEPYTDNERSSSSSPAKGRRRQQPPQGIAPRRAVSDGSTLLRHKRGQKDWDDTHFPPYRDDPDPGDWGEPQAKPDRKLAEEDWDVEGAAGKRDVQVMFTVPKARLRVVNADLDRASLRSASDGALSRTDSLKGARREESLRDLRTTSDGKKALLPVSAEDGNARERSAREDDLIGMQEKRKAA